MDSNFDEAWRGIKTTTKTAGYERTRKSSKETEEEDETEMETEMDVEESFVEWGRTGMV